MVKNFCLYVVIKIANIVRRIVSRFAKLCFPNEYAVLERRISLLCNEPLEDSFYRHINAIKLLVCGEDHRFAYHPGFDFIAILRAVKQRLIYHKREGASTIDQQLVRVLTGDYRRCPERKIKEIMLSATLFHFVDRKFIPLLYLKVAYYGTNLTGIEKYIKVKKIRGAVIPLAFAAELVARIKYPEPRNISVERQNKIERRITHLLSLYNKHSKSNIFCFCKL